MTDEMSIMTKCVQSYRLHFRIEIPFYTFVIWHDILLLGFFMISLVKIELRV